MSNFNFNGYTYEIITRPWKPKPLQKEYIKWKTGYRNFWSRISREEYSNAYMNCNDH